MQPLDATDFWGVFTLPTFPIARFMVTFLSFRSAVPEIWRVCDFLKFLKIQKITNSPYLRNHWPKTHKSHYKLCNGKSLKSKKPLRNQLRPRVAKQWWFFDFLPTRHNSATIDCTQNLRDFLLPKLIVLITKMVSELGLNRWLSWKMDFEFGKKPRGKVKVNSFI